MDDTGNGWSIGTPRGDYWCPRRKDGVSSQSSQWTPLCTDPGILYESCVTDNNNDEVSDENLVPQILDPETLR